MAEKRINGRIVLKHDVESNWQLATGFTPMAGEIIVYDIDESHSYERIKIGDGVQNVNNLKFYAGSWEDLTDRPFWSEGPTTVEWDGNIDGLTASSDGTSYKVSDLKPSSTEVIGGKLTFSDGSVMEITSDIIEGEGYIFSIYYGTVYINTTNGSAYNASLGVTLSEPGIYFQKNSYNQLVSFSYGDEIIHQLDEKFIPDAIARVSDIPDQIIDDALSDTSTNPVQNKVIAEALNSKWNKYICSADISSCNELFATVTNNTLAIISIGVGELVTLGLPQGDFFSFSISRVVGTASYTSINLIDVSNGAFWAVIREYDLKGNVTNEYVKQVAGAVDTELSETSENPVQNKVITEALNDVTPSIGENGNWYIGEVDTGIQAQGQNGDTPVKGVDYYTEEDKAEFEDYIDTELAKREQLKPEFANNISECSDTSKLYVLPDGYIYAYITKTETIHHKGENKFVASEATLNKRMGSSSLSAQDGYVWTGAIPVDLTKQSPFEIKVEGTKITEDTSIYQKIWLCADETGTSKLSAGVLLLGQTSSNYTTLLGDGTIHADYKGGAKLSDDIISNTKYIRIGFKFSDQAISSTSELSNVSITFPHETYIEETTTTDWFNTGHAFIPADYEDRIISLEETSDNHEDRISIIEDKLSDSESVTVPSYWKEPVNEAVEKVKGLQDVGGKDVINFMWFSDMHYYNNANGYVGNIGTLCKSIMNQCNIPLALMTGDTLTAGVLTTESDVISTLEEAMNILTPIGDGLMLIRGNHDDVYGSYTNGNTTTSYVNKVAPSKMWNKLHRPQAQDFRRVFGGDGTYFYLDNVPQKVRFVCLNNYFYDGEGYSNGTQKAMTSGFGTEQLEWLETIALAVESDWSVVIATHVPPTASTINGNTYYLSQIPDGAEFREIITNSDADILGIFCGHCHADAYVVNDLRCPIITITCAINTPYDGTEADRVVNSATETALDIVSIDKANCKIYTTRLGAGSDRVISY